MRSILYHPKVVSEVREIIAYYENISSALADAFWLELEDALKHAQEFPKRHHFDTSGRRRCNLSIFPYHFLYRVSDTSIKIIAVRHHKRNANYGITRK